MTALWKRQLEEQPDATQPGQPHDNAPPAQSAGQKLRRKPLAYPTPIISTFGVDSILDDGYTSSLRKVFDTHPPTQRLSQGSIHVVHYVPSEEHEAAVAQRLNCSDSENTPTTKAAAGPQPTSDIARRGLDEQGLLNRARSSLVN